MFVITGKLLNITHPFRVIYQNTSTRNIVEQHLQETSPTGCTRSDEIQQNIVTVFSNNGK